MILLPHIMRWPSQSIFIILSSLFFLLSISLAQQNINQIDANLAPDSEPTLLAPASLARVVVTEFLTEGMDSDVLTLTSTQYVDQNNNPVNPPASTDQGLETLKNAAIGIAVIIGVALLGIFILRKWKFSPTNRFREKMATAEGLRQRTSESDNDFRRDLHAP